jgi:hypothetical protein
MPKEPRSSSSVEIAVSRRRWLDRDQVSVSVWSGDPACNRRPPATRSLLRQRPHPRGELHIEVWYGDSLAGSVEIAKTGGFAQLLFTHSGPHLDATELSIRPDPEASGFRVAISIDARPETRAEEIASTLWPDTESAPEPYPTCFELMALRRAFFYR